MAQKESAYNSYIIPYIYKTYSAYYKLGHYREDVNYLVNCFQRTLLRKKEVR